MRQGAARAPSLARVVDVAEGLARGHPLAADDAVPGGDGPGVEGAVAVPTLAFAAW